MFLVTANIFQPLIDVFEAVLKAFHNTLHVPWGWAIVLLTVLIRALLLPLTVKQFHSMQRLQVHMPELKALQAKYKDDKQRQQQEVMKFYQENKVNPFGSCLPLALQLPVFLSLFYMLRQDLRKNICPDVQAQYQAQYAATHHIPLSQAAGQTTPCGVNHGANFLFIPDLTNKATGWVLLVLILLYVGTQLGSSLMMTTPGMDRNQRLLLLGMPIFFVVVIINFPAGLLVYWITTNAWTMGQQYVLRRRLGPMAPPTATTTTKGAAGATGTATAARAGSDGDGAAGGVSGLLRGRSKQPAASQPAEAPAAVASSGRQRRAAAPPPPPRKKKKRSGRRR